jgi:hypothetical protein
MPQEAWLEGPVEGVEPMLMPVAHALLQAREDLQTAVEGLSHDELWARPGGAASVGFHVRHTAGALDRLFSYARGETLSDAQRAAAAAESQAPGPEPALLLAQTLRAIEVALAQVRATPREALLEARRVGRAGAPSTVLGLLFHGAEHSSRHAGQAITTAKVVRGLRSPPA